MGLKTYAFAVVGLATCVLVASPAHDVVVENDAFRLVVGADAAAKSLVVKATGEECLDAEAKLPLFSVEQDRPFNNELKLMLPNKRTVFSATRLRREGECLVAGFAHGLYEARVRMNVAPSYIAFTLEDFPIDRKKSYDYLKMDIPPVAAFRLIQLPVRERRNFGDWLNICWDDRAAVCVAGLSPHPDVDHSDGRGIRTLFAEARAGIRLRGAAAALIAAPGREAFLDAMDAVERNHGLPRGVRSRRSHVVEEPIFHLDQDFAPSRIDEALDFAKRGGFRLMTFFDSHVFKSDRSWRLGGNYDWRDDWYPRGETDMKCMLSKLKKAGMSAGLHTFHTHIGLASRYVTPVADPRLNKTRRFTLAAPISEGEGLLAEISVFEPTTDVPRFEPCRILQFGGELFSYEDYTESPPYKFLRVKRGAHGTRSAAHPRGEVGGILDVSEFGGPGSCYLDQNSDLLEEVCSRLAKAYRCGFEYVYLDGSEGVNRPFNFHVASSQHRFWKMLSPSPIFCEGAAKTHFGWHMLSGANAFDTFRPEEFKEKLRAFPFVQAPRTWQDMTRVDFGWWAFLAPGTKDWTGASSIGTQPDMWEYGLSVAAAWDCAASMLMPLDELRRHPRTGDILETVRRWADLRRSGLFREEWRESLKNYSQEHHLLADGRGGYDLVAYDRIQVGDGTGPVRAFLFEKSGARWVVFWHASGESRLKLTIRPEDISLFDEFAGRPVEFAVTDGGVVLPVGNRRYIKTRLDMVAIRRVFSNAATLPSN